MTSDTPSDASPNALSDKLYTLLTGKADVRDGNDISERAAQHQPRNFLLHVVSLGATKTGDGLIDPKLVLAWVLGTLGAPAALIGLLVPVRESLSMLPQVFTSGPIGAMAQRKYAWAAGSAVQGLCAIGMAIVAVSLKGWVAGVAIVSLLAVFALARSICSVSYKDVLGKTVSKNTRGTATGTAAGVAAVLVTAFGAALSVGVLPLSVGTLSVFMVAGGLLWICASVLFLRLEEDVSAQSEDPRSLASVLCQFSVLFEDRQLLRFVCVRGLLIATALAPPLILALAGQASRHSIAELGPFVIASALASVASTYVWGRLADRSSRTVLIAAAIAGAAAVTGVGLAGLFMPALTSSTLFMAAMLFGLMIAYQGVRLGRSTHLVDMAREETRAVYTAVSNTAIGALVLAGGLFGVLADLIGSAGVLLIFGAMCLAAAFFARGLEEVQGS